MRTYKDVKICCYAICADEPKEFIDQWLESMSGADYICVLVTKRANDNYFQLREYQKKDRYKDKLIVEETAISPWRFDVARNESMKLIPEDSDVIISTDIDERLISDFWDDLRKIVFEHPDFERIFYRYAWSHDENGNPKWVFWYDKITQPKGWKWYYPVHEMLKCSVDTYNGKYYMDKDKVYLRHFPDESKSRSSYLELLKQRAVENPDDLYGLYYLAREYSFVRDYKNGLEIAYLLYVRLLSNPLESDTRILPTVLQMIGDFSFSLNQNEDAEFYYRKSIELAPDIRDGYVKLAQLYAYSNKPLECYKVIASMDMNSIYIEDWRLKTYYWRPWKINQILADAKCWEERYDEAYHFMVEAEKDIRTEDDKVDALRERFYTDLEFLKNKLELK